MEFFCNFFLKTKKAREHNKKVYQRMRGMYRKEEIQSIKRLIHFDRINEEIKDMTFLPYANALVASGQTGIYLVDMGMFLIFFPQNR